MKTTGFRSIFFKLVLVYCLSILIIAGGAVVAQELSSREPNVKVSIRNVHYYSTLLASQIGNPPSIGVAEHIARLTGLDIAIQGPGLSWSSSREIENKITRVAIGAEGSLWPFEEFGETLVHISEGAYQYYFMEFHADHRVSIFILIVIATSILAALVASYLLVRGLLRPLRSMHQVAKEFGVNDWKQRVHPRGKDELANLGRTMDSMADRIENYIRSMHELLIAISHELRSPLTRMKVALEFIDNQKIKESLSEEIQVLDTMTGAILEQKRLSTQSGALNREPVQLAAWAAELAEPYILAGAPLSVESVDGVIAANIDRARMDMAVRNLIENALRHAPGTPVTLSVRASTNPGRTGAIEVCDAGPGMSTLLIGRIGEPFLLADGARSGSRIQGGFGLGLSIVAAIVQAHGGSLSVQNRIPHGLSVIIEL